MERIERYERSDHSSTLWWGTKSALRPIGKGIALRRLGFRFKSGGADQTRGWPIDKALDCRSRSCGFNSRSARQMFMCRRARPDERPDSHSGDREFNSLLRRYGAEHERMSALSFKQVIAGSAPACATKVSLCPGCWWDSARSPKPLCLVRIGAGVPCLRSSTVELLTLNQ